MNREVKSQARHDLLPKSVRVRQCELIGDLLWVIQIIESMVMEVQYARYVQFIYTDSH